MASLFPGLAKSRRTPNTLAVFNNADVIERYLQLDSHKTWGWVIYRSTYDSEDEWEEFLRRLHARTVACLKFYQGLDMCGSLGFKVFEDKSLFDGASTAVIREHFRNWAETASQEEQGTGPGQSQRYQFCIQVDAEALHSVVHEAKAPSISDSMKTGWVKLIWKDWELETPDPMELPEEPIEGVTVEEIGWSRAAYAWVMVSTYAMIRGPHEWYREYRRPPTVIIP